MSNLGEQPAGLKSSLTLRIPILNLLSDTTTRSNRHLDIDRFEFRAPRPESWCEILASKLYGEEFHPALTIKVRGFAGGSADRMLLCVGGLRVALRPAHGP